MISAVEVKASAVELLEVMMEETSDKSSELAKEIACALDFTALHDTLADFHELMNDPKVGVDNKAKRGLFRTYHILVHLRDYTIAPTIKEQIGGCGDIKIVWMGDDDVIVSYFVDVVD